MKLSLALFLTAALSMAAGIDTAKTIGNPSAPVTIELFSDFQCPACRQLHMQTLPLLMRDYIIPGKAYLVYKEFPLNQHAHGKEAATWAVACARLGKYEQVADVLFETQPTWENDGNIAKALDKVLSPAEMKKAELLLKDPGVIAEVASDMQEGARESVNQTPTMVLIHGTKRYPIGGVVSYNLLRSLLDDLAK